MINRITRIFRLDFSVFKEIEADPNATVEAAIIVALSNLLAAIGTSLRADAPRAFVPTFLMSLVSGLVGWVIWTAVTHYLGKALYHSGASFESMLRVLGYATAPRFLGIFDFIRCFGALAGLAGLVLSLIAGIMAISEGLDVDTGQAIIVAVVGWIALFIVTAIIGIVFGGTALVTYGLCSAASR